MGWIAVQLNANSVLRGRRSARAWKRRIRSPSSVVSSRASTTCTSAWTMLLPRSFAMRNMKQGTPSWGATTAWRLKSTRAVGDQDVGEHHARHELPVADGRHGLHAEEERVDERPRARVPDAPGPGEVGEREEGVGR